MRKVNIEIFDFDELTENAKSKAFIAWHNSNIGNDYAWADEIRKIFKELKDHDFDVDYWFTSDSVDYGVHGVKYYGCTNINTLDVAINLYNSLTDFGKNECFTGYCESETFAKALKREIDYYDDCLTITCIVARAVCTMLASISADWEYLLSYECFIENYAHDNEYYVNGDVFAK